MKRTCCLLIFLLLTVFGPLASAAPPPTELPNLIGTWRGSTTAIGDTTSVAVKLVLTNVGANPGVPNGYFEGTLTIGEGVVNVSAGFNRDFPNRVMINQINASVLSGMQANLDWLPGPMLLVRGFSYDGMPYKPFILKKSTP